MSQSYSILSNNYQITYLSASYVAISSEFSKRSGDFLVLIVKYFEIYIYSKLHQKSGLETHVVGKGNEGIQTLVNSELLKLQANVSEYSRKHSPHLFSSLFPSLLEPLSHAVSSDSTYLLSQFFQNQGHISVVFSSSTFFTVIFFTRLNIPILLHSFPQ